MDSELYAAARLRSSAQRRCISRSDLFFGEEDEVDVNDELKAEFLCPFCADEFDVVGLCCHVDEEHPLQVKNGRRRRFRRGGSNSTYAILRKELRDGNLQSLLGGSFISSTTEPDPLLTSFISNRAAADNAESKPHSSDKAVTVKESLKEELRDRNVQQPKLSDKDREEEAQKCEFVHGLLLSTILDDVL